MSEMQSGPAAEPEIHRADPAERRRTIALLLIVLLSGLLLIAGMQSELDAIRVRIVSGETDLASDRFLWMARASFVLLALVGVVTAAVVARSSLAVIREQRYPHSAAKLLRDRVIARGRGAVLRGRLGLLLAAGFAVVGLLGAWVGWQLLESFA